MFQSSSADPQLTSVQFVTLCAINDFGPSSQVELVKSTAIDQASIRGIINRLRTRQLIKISVDRSDRRKVVAELTVKGRSVLARMIPSARRITAQTLNPLNPAEREAFLFLLRKLIENGGRE